MESATIFKYINSGFAPEDMKFARSRHIFKKNIPLYASNYKPVGILSTVSRSISIQLNDIKKDKNILYEYQSGFRGSYSTDTCLMHLLYHIKGNNAKELYTGMVVLDYLQKTFKSVAYSNLYKKLKDMGLFR